MSLENVYYWNKDGWKKITAEEFVKDNPNFRVSAKEKYFWCEMCGQYVTLANGRQRTYFKHSLTESEKDCEDRAKSFAKNDWIKSSQPAHNLSLKICLEQNNFYFKVGLPRLPQQIFDKAKKCCLKIQSVEKILSCCDLSDYLIEGETIWLDVGSSPAKFYSLTLEPEISEVNFYWSRKVEGINPNGTLFDVNTGRKILNDADIEVNLKYYLLTENQYVQSSKDVVAEKLFSKKIFKYDWFLYEVKATELSEEAAKFFLDYRCRLTAKPISISPIYPVHTQDDDAIYCNSEKIFVYFSGNAKIRFFPKIGNSILFEGNNSKLIEVAFNERQKMIAAGRSQILQYRYLWKNLSTAAVSLPKIEVKDLNDQNIYSGVHHILPKNSILQIFAEFDIQVVVGVGRKNNLIEKRFFHKAGKIFNVDNITFGTEIKIFQGWDCVWKIFYQREERGIAQSDTELFLKLEHGKGRKIKVPHAWGSFTDKLRNYPQVKSWLYKSIRIGFVSEESYLVFRQFVLGEI